MSETDLSRSIRKAVEALGVPIERIQCGQVRVRGGYMRLASEGTPDHWTPLCFLESKVPKTGKLRKAQREWQDKMLREWGVRTYNVRSVGDAVAVIRSELADREHERQMGWDVR